jgi:hypothetical protein
VDIEANHRSGKCGNEGKRCYSIVTDTFPQFHDADGRSPLDYLVLRRDVLFRRSRPTVRFVDPPMVFLAF